jgi:hypothetical protein
VGEERERWGRGLYRGRRRGRIHRNRRRVADDGKGKGQNGGTGREEKERGRRG